MVANAGTAISRTRSPCAPSTIRVSNCWTGCQTHVDLDGWIVSTNAGLVARKVDVRHALDHKRVVVVEREPVESIGAGRRNDSPHKRLLQDI